MNVLLKNILVKDAPPLKVKLQQLEKILLELYSCHTVNCNAINAKIIQYKVYICWQFTFVAVNIQEIDALLHFLSDRKLCNSWRSFQLNFFTFLLLFVQNILCIASWD